MVLDAKRIREQSDVDHLESRRSPIRLFYTLIGKQEEKLDKEKAEAYAAAVKYDSAAKQLSSLATEIEKRESELLLLAGCGERYEELLAEKLLAIKKSGQENADIILAAEEKISYIDQQIREIKEALAAGKQAHATVIRISNSLISAEELGVWDMMGGGLLASAAKHDELDQAQAEAELLQSQLNTFQTELTDITIHANLKVTIDEFLRFADCFFDGLYLDWTVQDKIKHSQEQVDETRDEIESVLEHLKDLLEKANDQYREAKQHLENTILEISPSM